MDEEGVQKGGHRSLSHRTFCYSIHTTSSQGSHDLLGVTHGESGRDFSTIWIAGDRRTESSSRLPASMAAMAIGHGSSRTLGRLRESGTQGVLRSVGL